MGVLGNNIFIKWSKVVFKVNGHLENGQLRQQLPHRKHEAATEVSALRSKRYSTHDSCGTGDELLCSPPLARRERGRGETVDLYLGSLEGIMLGCLKWQMRLFPGGLRSSPLLCSSQLSVSLSHFPLFTLFNPTYLPKSSSHSLSACLVHGAHVNVR